VLGDPCIKCSCDTVGWCGNLAKVALCEDWASGEPKVCPLLEGPSGET
jgi:hypothetical protein